MASQSNLVRLSYRKMKNTISPDRRKKNKSISLVSEKTETSLLLCPLIYSLTTAGPTQWPNYNLSERWSSQMFTKTWEWAEEEWGQVRDWTQLGLWAALQQGCAGWPAGSDGHCHLVLRKIFLMQTTWEFPRPTKLFPELLQKLRKENQSK